MSSSKDDANLRSRPSERAALREIFEQLKLTLDVAHGALELRVAPGRAVRPSNFNEEKVVRLALREAHRLYLEALVYEKRRTTAKKATKAANRTGPSTVNR